MALATTAAAKCYSVGMVYKPIGELGPDEHELEGKIYTNKDGSGDPVCELGEDDLENKKKEFFFKCVDDYAASFGTVGLGDDAKVVVQVLQGDDDVTEIELDADEVTYPAPLFGYGIAKGDSGC
ncbi:hypothetical protein ACJ41O_003422 [Fusarium nematophilum]